MGAALAPEEAQLLGRSVARAAEVPEAVVRPHQSAAAVEMQKMLSVAARQVAPVVESLGALEVLEE